MVENENTMEPETNPYDDLIEPPAEPVRSPVILGNAGGPEKQIEHENPMEIIPLSSDAIYSNVLTRECITIAVVKVDVEEDLLVPDTFPDMEIILNMGASVTAAEIHAENGQPLLGGELQLETMYRSSESYGVNISIIPAQVKFSRDLSDIDMEKTGQMSVHVNILRTEYRIINERKYKARIYMSVEIKKQEDAEHKIFDGIQGEELYLHKENIKLIDLVSHKTKESEVSEGLLINDDKIRPVKILKTDFVIAENHHQLTKDKLILNQTIWVRIMYLAELASKGNLSNQAMFYQSKIDHTQFIPLGKTETEITSYKAVSNANGLTAEINSESTGFNISGDIITDTELYGTISKEVVTDFYHSKEDMICDRKEEKICSDISNVFADCTLHESIVLQQEDGDEQRIIYLDGKVLESSASVEGTSVIVKGKVQLEAVTMNEGDYTVLARKICEFTCVKESAAEHGCRIESGNIFVREMTGDISGNRSVNLTVHIQAQAKIYNESALQYISNPCITKSGNQEKIYPITVYTVKEGETLWDIGKNFKTGEKQITAYNKPEDIVPGKKIIIVK